MRRLGWVLVGVWAGCTVRTEEHVLASLDAPVRARMLRVDEDQLDALCAGGHGFGFCVPEMRERTKVIVEVTTAAGAVSLRAEGCAANEAQPALAAPPDGRAVAWRCGGTYRHAYVGARGRSYFAGEAPVRDGAVDWGAVPPLASAAAALTEHVWGKELEALFEEVRAQGGDAALANLLVASAHRPLGAHHESSRGGPWAAAFQALPAESQARVKEGLAARVRAEPPGGRGDDVLLVHALVQGALEGPAHTATIAARLDGLIAHEGNRPEALMGGLVTALARVAPAEAGPRGCKMLSLRRGAGGPRPGRELLGPAVAAVAAAGTRCDALAELVEPCSSHIRCGSPGTQASNPVCSGDFMADRLELRPASYLTLAETSTASGSVGDLVLAALAKTGTPTPREVTLRNARRLYAIEGARPNDRCVVRAPNVQGCACLESAVREMACDAPIEGPARAGRAGCAIEVDDRRRLIVPTAAP